MWSGVATLARSRPNPKGLTPSVANRGQEGRILPLTVTNYFIVFLQVLQIRVKLHTLFQKDLCMNMDQQDIDGACRFMRACGRPWSVGRQQDAYEFMVFILQSLQVMHASLSSFLPLLRPYSGLPNFVLQSLQVMHASLSSFLSSDLTQVCPQQQRSTPAVACTPCMAT